MNTLYLLKFACCVITLLLAIMLVASRFQVRWPNRHYEVSRWLICFSMLGLAGHYVLQMKYGFRASSDLVGAVVNMLFYTPIALLISYATFNVICFREGRRRYQVTSVVSYLVILIVFAIGYWVNGSLQIGGFVYVMLALFTLTLCYSVGTTVREIQHHRKIIEEESGEDLLPYDRYTWASYLMMGLSVLVLVGGIVYRPFLFVIAPLMLLSLILFTITFIGYGYNIMPMDQLLDESSGRMKTGDLEVSEPNEQEADAKVSLEEKNVVAPALHANPMMSVIEEKLKQWCDDGGYRDSTINMPSLAKKLQIPRCELSRYFDQCMEGNFRAWLSDLRFQAAQQMLLENPGFNNDAVSVECGFSSHAHLYKIFKAKTGMTPGQWKDSKMVFHSHE